MGQTSPSPLPMVRRLVERALQTELPRYGFPADAPFAIHRLNVAGANAAKFVVTFAGSRPLALLVKRYEKSWVRPALVENEYRGLVSAHRALDADSGFRVPTPYAAYPEEKTLLMEHLPGRNVHSVLRPLRLSLLTWRLTASNDVLDVIERSAHLLATLQARTAIDDPRTPDAVRDAYMAFAVQYLDPCSAVMGPRWIAAAKSLVEDVLNSRLGSEQLVSEHHEFAPSNLLWDGGTLSLFDFGNFTTGSRLYDAAFFYIALALPRSYRFADRRLIARLQRRYLAAYRNASKASFDVDLFRALSLIHVGYFATVLLAERETFLKRGWYRLAPRAVVREWLEETWAWQPAG